MRNPLWNTPLWEEFYQDSSAFLIYATINYANGSYEAFTADDFVEGSFSYTEHSCGVSTFSINEVGSVEAKATLNNRGNRIGYRDFQNAVIRFELRLSNDRVENRNCDVRLHRLTITNAEYRGEYIELTAMDNLSATDGQGTISSTSSARALSSIASSPGITNGDYQDRRLSLSNVPGTGTLTIPVTTFNPPISIREILSACAEIAGCITVMRDSDQYILGLPFPIYDFTDDIDGGTFDYDDGDFAYGGEFYGSVGENQFPNKGRINEFTVTYGNGITWTYLGNGTVMANGTAITDCDYQLVRPFALETHQDVLTISSGLSGGSRSTYYIYGTVGNDESDEVGFDSVTNSGNAFNGNSDIINAGGYAYFGSMYLRICAGVTVNNLLFTPSAIIPSHTDLAQYSWVFSPATTNLGVTFSAYNHVNSYDVTGVATSNYPQATIKEGLLLEPGTYTLMDGSNSVYTGLGIHLYNNSAMTTKYSGECEGLHVTSSAVYVYTTTDGELTTSSNFKVIKSFTIKQQAYARIKGYTVGRGYTSSLNALCTPHMYRGAWETYNRMRLLTNHNLFFGKSSSYYGTYQPNALPFWHSRSLADGFTVKHYQYGFSFGGTPYENLLVPLATDFYIPPDDYVLRTHLYSNTTLPTFRFSNEETDEIIYEGTGSIAEFTLEEGYYSGYLVVSDGVNYGELGYAHSLQPTLFDKKQAENLSSEYWAGGWTTLPAYDGGLFVFWKTNRTVIRKDDAYPLIKILQNPIVSPTMITVTGVEVSGDGINTVKVGTEGYIIKIKDNPLITTQAVAQSAAELCLSNMEGVSFIPFSISNSANPRLEPGDMVIFQDVNGNDIVTFPTGIDYHLGNLTTANMIEQNASENAKFSSEE